MHTSNNYSLNAQASVGKNISQENKTVTLIVDTLSKLLKVEK